MPAKSRSVTAAFRPAHERYTALGVDVDAALRALARIPVSLHCLQGDDVGGFESGGNALGGGFAVTGNYPGKARTPDELRANLEKALSMVPGQHRVSLHAMYGEFGGMKVDRDEIEVGHFRNWIAWAKSQSLGLDFNPTCFAHPKSADGFTLSHCDLGLRQFWIEHCRRAREIGATGQAERVHLGLDYFDASINRIAAWVIGTRNLLRALLFALLEPPAIRAAELVGDTTARLAPQGRSPRAALWRGVGFLLRAKKCPRRRNLAARGKGV